MSNDIRVVAVSGGFDPVHIGHVRMFEEAKKLGTHLVVILNCDDWLVRKKGFAFMPEDERAELIKKFEAVDDVHIHHSDDVHVSDALRDYQMDIDGNLYPVHVFANGGDRKDEADIPEAEVCKGKNIELIFNIGHGGKVQSSSWLTNAVIEKNGLPRETRPWGKFETLGQDNHWWVKRLTVEPGHRLSLQSHKKRTELWVCIEGSVTAYRGTEKGDSYEIVEERELNVGDYFYVSTGELHRLGSKTGGAVVEVATGEVAEFDETRFEDDYNRTSPEQPT